MNKFTRLCAMFITAGSFISAAHAATPGTYFGAGLGSGRIDTQKDYAFSPYYGDNSYDLGGASGRAFGGYNFNKYFGVETGLTRYAQSKYSASDWSADASLKTNMDTLDVVGKGYLPFGDSGFNAYAFGGAAYARVKTNYHNNGVPLSGEVAVPNTTGTKSHGALRPIMGVGVSYDIPSTSLTANFELSHLQGKGNTKSDANAIPNANMLTLNLAYNIG